MLDDFNVIYIRLEDNKFYLRHVNMKLITSVCKLYGITIEQDNDNGMYYIDECDIAPFLNAMKSSHRHVTIL